MNVVSRIKELMQKRGWNEYRLVQESKLPASTLANIFHRGTTPGIATLECICDTLGISLSQFFADGEFIYLTADQKSLLDQWATLSEDQKQVLLELMTKMN